MPSPFFPFGALVDERMVCCSRARRPFPGVRGARARRRLVQGLAPGVGHDLVLYIHPPGIRIRVNIFL